MRDKTSSGRFLAIVSILLYCLLVFSTNSVLGEKVAAKKKAKGQSESKPARGSDLNAIQTARQKAINEGKKLLYEDIYEQAISAFGPWAAEMEPLLHRRIVEAERQDKKEKALELYQVYFRYYPCNKVYQCPAWRRRLDCGYRYAELLRKCGKTADNEAARQTIASSKVCREVEFHRQQGDLNKCVNLTDKIVAKYPLSVFCPTAVVSSGQSAERIQSSAAAVPIYERYLAQMKQAGVPKRSLILVMMSYASCASHGKNPDQLRKAIAAFREAGALTPIECEKQHCFLRAAYVAQRIGDAEHLELARKLFYQSLEQYPNSFLAHQSRSGIIKTYLAVKRYEQALVELRELEKTLPSDTDIGRELLIISRAYFRAHDYQKSLKLFQEVVERKSAVASEGYLGMGEVYQKLGDEEKMLAAYNRAVKIEPVDARLSAMDTTNTRNKAFRFLGRYYIDKQEWAEALKWWQAWKPTSLCGTCLESMKREKARNIALCLKHTIKPDGSGKASH